MSLSLSAAQTNPQTAAYQINLTEPALDKEHFLAEFLLVIWHRFASWFIGEPIVLMETHFTFAPPPHRDELEVMFPGKLKFNCATNRLIFDTKYLTKPLARTSQEVEDFKESAPAGVMVTPSFDNTLEAQVERLILGKNPDKLLFPTIHELSEELGVSVQTFHRRLKKNGSSYQRIKDNLRRSTAIKKLIGEQLSIDEVSEIVGFTESRSFTRAFRQWTGISPRAYKKVHLETK